MTYVFYLATVSRRPDKNPTEFTENLLFEEFVAMNVT